MSGHFDSDGKNCRRQRSRLAMILKCDIISKIFLQFYLTILRAKIDMPERWKKVDKANPISFKWLTGVFKCTHNVLSTNTNKFIQWPIAVYGNGEVLLINKHNRSINWLVLVVNYVIDMIIYVHNRCIFIVSTSTASAFFPASPGEFGSDRPANGICDRYGNHDLEYNIHWSNTNK